MLNRPKFQALYRALGVERAPDGVNDTAFQTLNRNLDDMAGTAHLHPLGYLILPVEQSDAIVIFCQRQRHAVNLSGQFHQLAELQALQAICPKNTVPDFKDMAKRRNLGFIFKRIHFIADYIG